VFQNPYRALNPRHTVREILATAVRHFFPLSKAEAAAEVATVLEKVALPPELASRYARELSGGERQRVAIARALICRPELLICDEITSALDVSVQAAILDLLRDLQQQENLTVLFVTHDLGVVRAIADYVAVLQHGEIVEHGPVGRVLDAPDHAYTRSLVADSPRLRAEAA
jgi:peptide/nickel transport system ATP-binding protein